MAKAFGFQRIQKEVSLEGQIRRFAPAALTTSPHPVCSDKYQFVNTMDFVNEVATLGWEVEAVGQRISKDPEEALYGRHMIKFKHPDYIMPNGDYYQLVISNAHNRMARLRADAGIFRLICSNGMIIKIQDQLSLSETHRNTTPEMLMEAVKKALQGIGTLAPHVEAMQHRIMTEEERYEFARQALEARHFDDQIADLPKSALINFLKPIRKEDQGDSLWVTYNVAQEKLISGEYFMHNKAKTKLRKQQSITSAEVDYKVNTQLSELALSWV